MTNLDVTQSAADIVLSSSRFSAAAGLNPYKSRQALWRELTGRKDPDPVNAAMQWGIDNEYRAVAAAEAATGIMFTLTGERQKRHFLHIDGLDLSSLPDGARARTGLEVKCPQKLYDEVPGHYMAQVQGQMLVCGFDTVIFGAWTPEGSRVWNVPRSAEYIDDLVRHLQTFKCFLNSDKEPTRFSSKKNPKPVMPSVTYQLIHGEQNE